MKKIAVTQRLVKNTSYYEIREALDINWGALLDTLGFEPVILPLRYDFKKTPFDGLILTGGNDLSVISGDATDKLRDDFEKSLLDYCIARNMPVLGICRGMQMINFYFGGTLKKVENHAGTKHFLDTGIEVNSYHGYAVDAPGRGLQVIARSNDGVIEIMRHEKHNIYAQMAHPERCVPFNEHDVKFIKNFFGGL